MRRNYEHLESQSNGNIMKVNIQQNPHHLEILAAYHGILNMGRSRQREQILIDIEEYLKGTLLS